MRVPNLDGSVMPLPKAELNLDDTGLVNALDALAKLDAGSGSQGGSPVSRDPDSAAPSAVAVPSDAGPVPLPEPVDVEPPLPAEVVVSPPAPKTEDDAGQSGTDPLRQLAEVAETQSGAARAAGTGQRIWQPTVLVALCAGGMLLFASGFFVGRSLDSEPRMTAEHLEDVPGSSLDDTDAAPQAELPNENVAGFSPALTGRILYLTSDGVPRPDDGARILVLPQERQGTSKLSVVGFRSGASSTDQQFARSSLREAGGDYAITDSDGRYTIQLPTAGTYHVLLISRHQPRNDGEFLEPDLQRILRGYFDRPTGLIGSVMYELSEFRYQGGRPAPRDHTFSR